MKRQAFIHSVPYKPPTQSPRIAEMNIDHHLGGLNEWNSSITMWLLRPNIDELEYIPWVYPHTFNWSLCVCVCVCAPFSYVSFLFTPWTVAHQSPLSVGFPREENGSWLPFPSPGDLSDPGIKPRSLALWADALPSEPQGKPNWSLSDCKKIIIVITERERKTDNVSQWTFSFKNKKRYATCLIISWLFK